MSPARTTLLCLGNELLGDDGFGVAVARLLETPPLDSAQVAVSCASGLHLLDYFAPVERLVVVDSIVTGRAAPGTLSVLDQDDLAGRGAAAHPHALGLLEVLALARLLGLPAPQRLTLVVAEAADCTTFGAPMHPAVKAAVARAAALCRDLAAPLTCPP